jgi:hypothetical protein
LREAKAEYFNLTGPHSFSPYDEKVLAQSTLYGLPMMRLEMPGASQLGERESTSGRLSQPRNSNGLISRQATFEPTYETHTLSEGNITGTYLTVGEEAEVNEWQPIQPRTSLDITLAEQTPHGAFFEGGRYQTLADFDPVVTRIITETTDMAFWQVEPGFDHPGTWQPSWWSLVNQVWTPDGVQERLVVIPAQYRSTTPELGTERLFEVMTYTVYYSTTTDLVPPSLWSIDAYRLGTSSQVVVEATDLSDVVRLGVAYTLGDGVWRTTDLARSAGNPNLWAGTIPYEETMEWFVQAVDGAGNVAINDNKGAYLGLPGERIWLPLISRDS